MPKRSFQQLFPNANPDALGLLNRMLAFDPTSRISVEEALEHRYLHIWHDVQDEPACQSTFDFAFEVVDEVPQMRRMILEEVQRFRQIVRMQQPHAQAGAALQQQQQQQQQGQQNVPIPAETGGQWSQEVPRPQEAAMAQQAQGMGLEQELQGGLDAMQS